jgi:hypothetical protein
VFGYSKNGRNKFPKGAVSAPGLLSDGEISSIYDGFMVVDTFREELGLSE